MSSVPSKSVTGVLIAYVQRRSLALLFHARNTVEESLQKAGHLSAILSEDWPLVCVHGSNP